MYICFFLFLLVEKFFYVWSGEAPEGKQAGGTVGEAELEVAFVFLVDTTGQRRMSAGGDGLKERE